MAKRKKQAKPSTKVIRSRIKVGRNFVSGDLIENHTHINIFSQNNPPDTTNHTANSNSEFPVAIIEPAPYVIEDGMG